jgi:hypothetical protein
VNWRTVGFGLTLAAVALVVLVVLVDRPDWWGGPAIFGVMVALYWSLGPVLFDPDSS